MEKIVLIGVRIEKSLKDNLEYYAGKEGLLLSEFIRKVLREEIRKRKDEEVILDKAPKEKTSGKEEKKELDKNWPFIEP